MPLIDAVHSHSIARFSLPGPRACFLRTASGWGSPLWSEACDGYRTPTSRSLCARIHADPRHKNVALLLCESITRRRYGEWSMARGSRSDVDPQTKIAWPEFDPSSAGGSLVMARIDKLVAHGSPVQAP